MLSVATIKALLFFSMFKQEEELDTMMQTLATDLSTVYEKYAPQAFQNQVILLSLDECMISSHRINTSSFKGWRECLNDQLMD